MNIQPEFPSQTTLTPLQIIELQFSDVHPFRKLLLAAYEDGQLIASFVEITSGQQLVFTGIPEEFRDDTACAALKKDVLGMCGATLVVMQESRKQ